MLSRSLAFANYGQGGTFIFAFIDTDSGFQKHAGRGNIDARAPAQRDHRNWLLVFDAGMTGEQRAVFARSRRGTKRDI